MSYASDTTVPVERTRMDERPEQAPLESLGAGSDLEVGQVCTRCATQLYLVEQDGETISTPMDKRSAGSGFPGEGYRRRTGDAPSRSVVWAANEAQAFDPAPVWGAYPKRFVDWAICAIQCRPAEVLHVCSGALGPDVGGLRVDLRHEASPDVRADARRLPFRDASFSGVLIDPPYSVEYAERLYGTKYPRPSHLLREACRLLVPGGRVGFLHFLVPMPGTRDLTIERVHGVYQGCGYRMRAFTVFRKRDACLFSQVAS